MLSLAYSCSMLLKLFISATMHLHWFMLSITWFDCDLCWWYHCCLSPFLDQDTVHAVLSSDQCGCLMITRQKQPSKQLKQSQNKRRKSVFNCLNKWPKSKSRNTHFDKLLNLMFWWRNTDACTHETEVPYKNGIWKSSNWRALALLLTPHKRSQMEIICFP